MVVGCGPKLTKGLMIVVNLIVFLAGAIILIGSGVFFARRGSLAEIVGKHTQIELPSDMSKLLIGGMILGAFICLTGFLACAGAWFENRLFLTLFAIFMGTLLIAQIVLGSLAFTRKDQMGEEFKKALIKGAEKVQNGTGVCKALQESAKAANCCEIGDKEVIGADCKLRTSCPPDAEKSCGKAFWERIYSSMKQYGGIFIGVMLFEFMAVVFAFCLCSSIGKSDYRNV